MSTTDTQALVALIEAYADARHKHGAPEYNAVSSAARAAVVAALALAQPAPQGWRTIESAPKDGAYFIALVGGLPYKARYDENGRFIRMAHTNRKGYGRSTTVHHVDGKELIEVLKEGEDDSYGVSGLIWARGFDFEPTQWMPLPAGDAPLQGEGK